jgi:hypothetical protein
VLENQVVGRIHFVQKYIKPIRDFLKKFSGNKKAGIYDKLNL